MRINGILLSLDENQTGIHSAIDILQACVSAFQDLSGDPAETVSFSINNGLGLEMQLIGFVSPITGYLAFSVVSVKNTPTDEAAS